MNKRSKFISKCPTKYLLSDRIILFMQNYQQMMPFFNLRVRIFFQQVRNYNNL